MTLSDARHCQADSPMQGAPMCVFYAVYGVGMRVWQVDWIVSLNSTSTLEYAFLILFQTQPLLIVCHLVVQTPLSALSPEEVLSLYLVGRQGFRHSFFSL